MGLEFYMTPNVSKIGLLMIANIIIAFIVLYLITAIVKWKIFVKAGEKGWKALIPVYSQYIEFKICWDTKYFWMIFIISICSSVLLLIPVIGLSIMMIGMICILVITIQEKLQLAKSFGKDNGFGIGLCVIPLVFELMLAIDTNIQYNGIQETPEYFNNIKSLLEK